MIKLLFLLIVLGIMAFFVYYFTVNTVKIMNALGPGGVRKPTKLYWCACGCNKKFRYGAPWDGYHGPGHNRPVLYDSQMLTENKPQKAIDYEPENVIGWEDIQWTVEKRLPKEK